VARKNLLAGLLETATATHQENELTAVNHRDAVVSAVDLTSTFSGRGAVGAMSRSLERLTSEVNAARSVESQLTAGTTAVELDPSVVDPSPVPDRLPAASSESEETFIAAIRERGQETPILVRPHPAAPGRYQVAFGHRRLRAAAALGRPVRAFVKDLTDEQLVVAQGQENNAREDLSFIERASFARALEDRGHTRDVIMAALVVDKTELSRLISVRRAIPDFVVSAIGPAPKAGRRRWMALSERLELHDAQVHAQQLITQAGFSAAASDERFTRLLSALQTPVRAKVPSNRVWTTQDGTQIARIESTKYSFQLTIDERIAPEFGEFVLSQFASLYDAYKRAKPN
jgi:ParB family chromosome partitioning protein